MPLLSTCLFALAVASAPQDGLIGSSFPAAKYPTGTSEAIPATGDIDGDGHQDLVVFSRIFLQPGLSVLFGRGDGTFEPALRISLHARANGLAVGDIDGDGDLDMAVSTEFAQGFRILRNNGERQFTFSSVSFLNGLSGQVDLIDVDQNGTLDLVISQGLAPWIDVSLNTGAGNFIFPIRSTLDGTFTRLDAGDVNSDGIPDVILTGLSRDEVDVALGDGLGGFSNSTSYPMGAGPESGILRDTNGDGVLDMVAVEEDDGTISVRPGVGDGTFGARFSRQVGGPVAFVEVAEPGPGDQVDFVVTRGFTPDAGWGSIGVIDGEAGLPTGPQSDFEGGFRPKGITVNDFNEDGISDFAIVNWSGGDISIYLGSSEDVVERPTEIQLDFEPGDVHLGDVNGDGILDTFGANEALNSWATLGDGTGGFLLPPVISDTGLLAISSLSDDLNADGNPDLVVFHLQGGGSRAQVQLGDGAGGFTNGQSLEGIVSWAKASGIGDLNGDGILDVVGRRAGAGYRTYLGVGDGTFTMLPDSNDNIEFVEAALGDVDNDGSLDLLLRSVDRLLSVRLGDGTGAFTPGFSISLNDDATSFSVGDINGDGWLDAVVGVREGFSSSSNAVHTAFGAGDGTLVLTGEQDIAVDPRCVTVVDVNMDGLDDVVAFQPTAFSNVAVLRSLGTEFQSPEYFGPLWGASGLVVDDVNGDGNPDLIMAHPGSNSLSVHLNRADVRLTTFCDAQPNSTGAPATLSSTGSRSFALDEFQIQVGSLPANELVTWFSGGSPGGRALPGGMLCIGGSLMRNSMPLSSGASGQASLNADFVTSGIQPGTTWYFQCWYSDAMGPARHFNFSNALAVLVAP